MAMPSRDRYVDQSFGSTFTAHMKKSRVLLVGAGGIGCELLKNLLLTGFGEIHVIDLDTIDLSNLNRQFLFRQEHIKKSKAIIAKESAGRFNRNAKIEAYHANIKDAQFDVQFFEQFEIVFNALDNLEARRHVNRMCLAANVPLIESGTTGFNGQVQVIKRGESECYDCTEKVTPKTFPVCTIRSTPTQPIHCIVWAKSYLFEQIFGDSQDESDELDHSEDSENAEEIANLKREAQALSQIRKSVGSADFEKSLFNKVFVEDINRLRSMEDMWKARRPPDILDHKELTAGGEKLAKDINRQDQSAWNPAENLAVFKSSLQRLSDRVRDTTEKSNGDAKSQVLQFDKDDEDTLDFVTATANLRAIAFGIEAKSKFDVKEMAGNIIPAIATTNAMTAGLCVLQAIKVMQNAWDQACMIFLTRSTERAVTTDTVHPPNPLCPVCGAAQGRINVDLSRATLDDIVQSFLRGTLNYKSDLSVSREEGLMYDPDLDDNLPKKLVDLGVQDGMFLTVTDEDEDDPHVNLSLLVRNSTIKPEMTPVAATSIINVPKKGKKDAHPAGGYVMTVVNGDNVLKRKREAADLPPTPVAEHATKKGKVDSDDEAGNSKDDNVVVVDGADSGPIVIDD